MNAPRILAVVLTGASVLFAVRALLEPRRPVQRTLGLPWWIEHAAIVPVIPGLTVRAAVDREAVAASGWDPQVASPLIARARSAGVVIGALVTVGLSMWSVRWLVVGVAGMGFAWLWPLHMIRAHRVRRREEMRRQLPDMLDVVALCADAGMAVDPTLRTVAHGMRGPLAMEIRTAIADIDAGSMRRHAYGALRQRVGVPDVERFLTSLIDAEETGAPLAKVMRAHAARARDDHRRRAHQRAAAASPRIQLVVAAVMVPAALLMVIAVMVSELARQVGPVFTQLG